MAAAKILSKVAEPTRKIKTNTKRKTSFLYRKLPDGFICNPRQRFQLLVKLSTMQWMQSKKITPYFVGKLNAAIRENLKKVKLV